MYTICGETNDDYFLQWHKLHKEGKTLAGRRYVDKTQNRKKDFARKSIASKDCIQIEEYCKEGEELDMLESQIGHRPKSFEKILAELKGGKKKKDKEFRKEAVDKEQEVGENEDFEEEEADEEKEGGFLQWMASEKQKQETVWHQSGRQKIQEAKKSSIFCQQLQSQHRRSIFGNRGRQRLPDFSPL